MKPRQRLPGRKTPRRQMVRDAEERTEVLLMQKEHVLVICTGNSARSQMAEGLFRAYGHGSVAVHSAGSEPADSVNPHAIAAMAEIGIDISHHRPKHLSQFLDQDIDWVIAVCSRAAAACPVFPAAPLTLHWFYDDPAAVTGTEEEQQDAFRRVRDDLAQRIRAWLATPSERRRAESHDDSPSLHIGGIMRQ